MMPYQIPQGAQNLAPMGLGQDTLGLLGQDVGNQYQNQLQTLLGFQQQRGLDTSGNAALANQFIGTPQNVVNQAISPYAIQAARTGQGQQFQQGQLQQQISQQQALQQLIGGQQFGLQELIGGQQGMELAAQGANQYGLQGLRGQQQLGLQQGEQQFETGLENTQFGQQQGITQQEQNYNLLLQQQSAQYDQELSRLREQLNAQLTQANSPKITWGSVGANIGKKLGQLTGGLL